MALATAAGISTYILLSMLGVPFAVPLAVLMAFFDLIPLVGSTIGGVLSRSSRCSPTSRRTRSSGWRSSIIYQQFENSVLQPLVYRRAVNLHPLAVIIAILIGSNLIGVLGRWWRSRSPRAIQITLKDVWANRPSSVVDPDGRAARDGGRRVPPREVDAPQPAPQTKT